MDIENNPFSQGDDPTMGVPRMSEEINPQNLADLFSTDPDCPNGNDAKPTRAMTFAGSKLDDELEMKKLQVFVRIRPSVTEGAPRWNTENCIHASSKHSLAIAPPETSLAYRSGDRGQTFSFTHVFDAETSQEQYFSATAAPLVEDLLRNPLHNSAMMAYGITAAGKTYTIEGTKTAPGVMPRSLAALFEGLAAHVDSTSLAVRVSYCEIYNESVFDLLEDAPVAWPRQRPTLRLMEDSRGRVVVSGLSEEEVGSADEALALLKRGAKHRQRAETGLNYNSSRSHSIFTINLVHRGKVGRGEKDGDEDEDEEETDTAPQRKEERLGRMSFVDLAGSERAQRTGNVGIRLKESVAINSSLMTLGRCLEALRWNQQQQQVTRAGGAAAPLRVVPYRESKVTHLFRDALHGYGRVVLSVNVSPCAKDYDETAHVLRYAALATQIGTLQQAEAPRRTIKAVTPSALRRAKRKAASKAAAGGGAKKAKAVETESRATQTEAEEEEGEQAAEEVVYEVMSRLDEGIIEEDSQMELPRITEEASFGEQQHQTFSPLDPGFAAHTGADVSPSLPHYHDNPFTGSTPGDAETPSTPSDVVADEAMAALQAQVQQLIADLQAAEERAVMVEGEVREEVAAEMGQLLKDMEESYKERLAAEIAIAETRFAGHEGAGKGKGRGKKGAQRAKHAGSEEAEKENLAEKRAVAAENAAAEALQQVETLRAELELHMEEARMQAERLAHVEGALHEAQSAAAAAQEEAARALKDLCAERERCAALEMSLLESRRRSEELVAGAAVEMTERLREEVTQLEANQSMQIEMAEQQSERLRKENLQLRQRLGMAMATLESVSSPSATLVQRMAAACPQGNNGCGVGGTPHEVALARARKAAAAEDAAAAAELDAVAVLVDSKAIAATTVRDKSTGDKSGSGSGKRSRFAQEAAVAEQQQQQPSSGKTRPTKSSPLKYMEVLATQPQEGVEIDCQEEEKGEEEAKAEAMVVAAEDAIDADAMATDDTSPQEQQNEIQEEVAQLKPAKEKKGRKKAGGRRRRAASPAVEDASCLDAALIEEEEDVQEPECKRPRASLEAQMDAIQVDAHIASPATAAVSVESMEEEQQVAEAEAPVETEETLFSIQAMETDKDDSVIVPEDGAPPTATDDATANAGVLAEQVDAADVEEPAEPAAKGKKKAPRAKGQRRRRRAAVAETVQEDVASMDIHSDTVVMDDNEASMPPQVDETSLESAATRRARRHALSSAETAAPNEEEQDEGEEVVEEEEETAALLERQCSKGAALPVIEEDAPLVEASPLPVVEQQPVEQQAEITVMPMEGKGVEEGEAVVASVEPPEQSEVEKPARKRRGKSSNAATQDPVEEKKEGKPEPEAAPVAVKGRRRRLLQPTKPMSAQLRCALGEISEADVPRRSDSAVKNLKPTAVDLGLSPMKAPNKVRSPSMRARRH